MSAPTTGFLFSKTLGPAAPTGAQVATPQTDNGTPEQIIDFAVPNTGGVAAKTASYTAVAGDCGKLLSFTSAMALTLTLPATPPAVLAGSQWQIAVQNVGAGVLTITPASAALLDGSASSMTLAQNCGAAIYTDGTNYFSNRGSNAGTVTSVSATVPSFLSVSVATPTTTPAIAIAATSQSAGLFLASPAGASGPMAPRTIVATDIPVGGVTVKTSNYTAVSGDTGKLISFNSASAVTLTLPAAPPNASWNIEVANIGAGTLTVSPNGLNLDGASGSISLTTKQGACIGTDGANYFSQLGAGITSLNSLTGGLTIAGAGGNTVTASGSTITITGSGGGGGGGGGLLAGVLSATPATTSTGFTNAWNQGGTFSSSNSAIGITMYDTTAASAIKMQGWYKAYPGVPFTATALFSLPPTGQNGNNFGFAAMASPTGHLIRWSTRQSSSSQAQFSQYIESCASPTSFNASIYNTQISFGSYIWMRYKDDGTNITSYFSSDGVNWFQLDSFTKSGSYLGSSGYVDFAIYIDPETTALGTTLMSYSETYP